MIVSMMRDFSHNHPKKIENQPYSSRARLECAFSEKGVWMLLIGVIEKFKLKFDTAE